MTRTRRRATRSQEQVTLERADGSEPTTGTTRRTFLTGVGATVAIGALGFDTVAKAVAEPWQGTAPARWRRPLLGALYEPGHRSAEVWPHLRVSPGPYLGSYDSADPGVIDTHRIWARKYGLDFFLVSYRGDRNSAYQWKNTRKLLAASTRDGYPRIAVMIEPDPVSKALQDGRDRGTISGAAYAQAMSRWFAERYDALVGQHRWFEQPSYLVGSDGRPILGYRSQDDTSVTLAILAATYQLRPQIAKSHWLWYAGDQPTRADARGVYDLLEDSRGAWFQVTPAPGQGWAGSRRLYESLGSSFGQRVVSLSPAPAPAQETVEQQRERWLRQLAEVQQLSICPTHLVIDSFNHWASGNAIEPPGRRRPVYMESLRTWRRTAQASAQET